MNPGRIVVGTAAILALCLAMPARAQVTGFGGNGANWTLNHDPRSQGVPSITNNVLLLGAGKNDATSAFYNTPQYVGSFTASFLFQNANTNDQAGFVFAMQNQGTNAVGQLGGDYLGYVGMSLAAGIAFNLNSNGLQPGLGYAPTQVPGGGSGGFIPTGGVNFDATNAIAVKITYANSLLGVTVTDTVTGSNFSANFIENLPVAVGGSTAFVGFTGGGTELLNLSITNFLFTPAAQPLPQTNFPAKLSPGTNVDVGKITNNASDGVIAYNPLNPTQLFIAANTNVEAGLFGAYCTNAILGTNNNVATWTQVSLTNLPVGAYPAAAWDGYGNLFLAYEDGSFPGLGIDVAVSTNYGKNFRLVTNLATGHTVQEPRIAVGAGPALGSVWVLYKDYSLAYGPLVAQGAAVTNTNAVGTFGLPEIVPGTTNNCGHGDIVVGPEGQVMVAYQNLYHFAGAANCYVSVDPDGLGPGAFLPPVLAAANAIGGATVIPAQPDGFGINAAAGLAWDGSPASQQFGRVYLVCVGMGSSNPNDTDIFVSYSTDSGATWSAQHTVNDDSGNNSQFLPRAAVDPTSGALALTWYDCRNDTGNITITNLTPYQLIFIDVVTNDPGDTPPTNFTTNYSTNFDTSNFTNPPTYYITNFTTQPSGTANQAALIYGTVSLNGGVTFQPNVKVSLDAGTGTNTGYESFLAGSQDFGDYIGLTCYGGNFYPVWADNAVPTYSVTLITNTTKTSTNITTNTVLHSFLTNFLHIEVAAVTLSGLADLSIASALVNPTNYAQAATNILQIGSLLDYLITVSNSGPSVVTAAYVTNYFPPNVQVVIAFATNTNNATIRGNYLLSGSPQTGTILTWPVGKLAIGSTATILVETTAVAIGNVTNFAVVSPGASVSDVLTNNNTTNMVSTVWGADLLLSVTASPGQIGYGLPLVTYTVTVSNQGPVAATGVLISNLLSPNMVLTGVSLPMAYTYYTDASDNSVMFNIGALTNGQVVAVSMTASASTNLASAGPGSASCTSIVLGVIDPSFTNNTAQAMVPILTPDLAIGVTAAPPFMAVGDMVAYTLYVTNLGPVPVFGVAVTNFLPPNLHFAGASVRKGTYTSYPDTNIVGQTDIVVTFNEPLFVGQSTLAIINATGLALGPATNVAVVGDITADLNPTNNTAHAVAQVVPPDMAIGMTGSPNFMAVGDSVTYTLKVTNLGPVVAQAVLISNALPTNLTFTAASVPGGTYTNSPDTNTPGQTDIIISLGTMAVGQTATMTIKATSLSLGLNANVAVVSSSQADPNFVNNTAQVTTPVVAPDMAIRMTGSPSLITVGQRVVYTMTVTNLGMVPAKGVTISCALPANLSFVSATTPSGVTYSVTSVGADFNIGSMSVGQRATVTLTASAPGLGSDPTVAVVSSSQTDPNPGNNTAEVATAVDAPDVAVEMTGSPDTVFVGQTVTYTITVANLGPFPATAVTVSDTLPGNLAFEGLSAPVGMTYSASQYGAVFNIGDMTNGQSATVSLIALAVSSGQAINTAVVNDTLTDSMYANSAASAVTTINDAQMFSNLTVVQGGTGVFITWHSPYDATSQVNYGLTASVSNHSWLNPALTNYHVVLLTGLLPDTNYYFQPFSSTGATPASDATNQSIVTFSNAIPSASFTTSGSFSTASTVILSTGDASYSGPGWLAGGDAAGIYPNNGSYVYDFVEGVGGSASTASATYTPSILISGLYDISLWYPTKAAAFSSNTPIGATGTTNVVLTNVNQTIAGGGWNPVVTGLYYTNGITGNLTIFNNSGDPATSVAANGVRWSYNLAQDASPNGTVPGWWANFYFGGSVSGTADSNGSGYSNFAKYVLGIDPTTRSSQLQFTVTPGPSTNVTATFAPYQGGRVYQLQSSTNLRNSAWVTLTNTPSQNTNNGCGFFTVGQPRGATVFYRLAASLAPNQ